MIEIADKTNEIITAFKDRLQLAIHEDKVRLGIKHNPRLSPTTNRVKVKELDGQINRLTIVTDKGEIMTHKGKGRYPEKRVAKPFITEPTDELLPDLADELAEVTGDTI